MYFHLEELKIISKAEALILLNNGYKRVNNIIGSKNMLEIYISDKTYRTKINDTFNYLLKSNEVSSDSVREQLLGMTIPEILQKRLVSKKWRNIIDEDSFWSRLIKRDFDEDINNINVNNPMYNASLTLSNILPENLRDHVPNPLKTVYVLENLLQYFDSILLIRMNSMLNSGNKEQITLWGMLIKNILKKKHKMDMLRGNRSNIKEFLEKHFKQIINKIIYNEVRKVPKLWKYLSILIGSSKSNLNNNIINSGVNDRIALVLTSLVSFEKLKYKMMNVLVDYDT
jgi:hypothetical protein